MVLNLCFVTYLNFNGGLYLLLSTNSGSNKSDKKWSLDSSVGVDKVHSWQTLNPYPLSASEFLLIPLHYILIISYQLAGR